MSKIVIIGGGIIGSAVAWYLAKSGMTDVVVVIEADPAYKFSAISRAFQPSILLVH